MLSGLRCQNCGPCNSAGTPARRDGTGPGTADGGTVVLSVSRTLDTTTECWYCMSQYCDLINWILDNIGQFGQWKQKYLEAWQQYQHGEKQSAAAGSAIFVWRHGLCCWWRQRECQDRWHHSCYVLWPNVPSSDPHGHHLRHLHPHPHLQCHRHPRISLVSSLLNYKKLLQISRIKWLKITIFNKTTLFTVECNQYINRRILPIQLVSSTNENFT